jgi:hypothetical protein
MTEIGSDSMGPTIGDFVAGIIGTLRDKRFGVKGTAPIWFEFTHHCFDEVLDVICSECCVGLSQRRYIGVAVFIVDLLF